MDEKDEMSQATIDDAQYLQQLRQRINTKAEKFVKMRITGDPEHRWRTIATWAAAIIVLVLAGVMSYGTPNFWAYLAGLGAGFIVFFILYMIMRHCLTSMKNASTAPQQYRAVKRLISAHKLQSWLPLATAAICWFLVMYGLDFQSDSFIVFICYFVIFIVSRMWFIDEDFYYDIKALGKYE